MTFHVRCKNSQGRCKRSQGRCAPPLKIRPFLAWWGGFWCHKITPGCEQLICHSSHWLGNFEYFYAHTNAWEWGHVTGLYNIIPRASALRLLQQAIIVCFVEIQHFGLINLTMNACSITNFPQPPDREILPSVLTQYWFPQVGNITIFDQWWLTGVAGVWIITFSRKCQIPTPCPPPGLTLIGALFIYYYLGAFITSCF